MSGVILQSGRRCGKKTAYERELLEMAAKAAGWVSAEFQDMRGWGEARYGFSEALWVPELDSYVNPLEDDGDEARLEAHLSFKVEWYPALVLVGPHDGRLYAAYFDDHNGDKQKARRWAGTRAAAEIGRAMP